MMRSLRPILRFLAVIAIFVALASLAPACVAFAADPVFPPGSRVGLVPPAGMEPGQGVQGFEDPNTHASIFVTEMSLQTYPEIEKEFSAAELKSSGIEEESREDVTLKDGTGFIVVAHQKVADQSLRKWALVAKLGDLTAVVLILVPEAAKDTYPDAALRQTLATVTVRPRMPTEQQLALLPYTIGDLGGFQLVRARPDGIALLTYGPNPAAIAEEQPFFLIATPNRPAPGPGQREGFARQLLATAWDFKQARNLRAAEIKIGGDPAHEIIGEVTSSKTGAELNVVQWLRFGGSGSYLQMLGVARRDAWDDVLPHMRALRDSIGPK
jgi:hypothetical protein